MTENLKQETGCGCSGANSALLTETTGEKFVARKAPKKEIEIEFLYLDLEVCEMCRGTEINLEEALHEVSTVLQKTGVKVNLKKIHIESYEQAQELIFISSPTVRVNGRDVSLEVKENYCSKCSELSGTETYCRVWNFQGEEFSSVPKSLVIEAVLEEIYGAGNGHEQRTVPTKQIAQSLDNLKRFFEGRKKRKNAFKAKTVVTEQALLPDSLPETASVAGCGCS